MSLYVRDRGLLDPGRDAGCMRSASQSDSELSMTGPGQVLEFLGTK